jgi:hypothetical protein
MGADDGLCKPVRGADPAHATTRRRELVEMAARRTQRGPATGRPEGAGGPQPWLTVIVLLGAAPFLAGGIWALLWPRSFYESVATFPPFNLHLFHDAGAFQLGIAAALIGGLLWSDALTVGLLGGVVGSTMHAISHFLDRELGGRASDPYTLGALALLLVTALVIRVRWLRR